MSTIYSYIYYHLFDLVSRIRKLNARESAILYISAIVFFLTMPFIAVCIKLIGNTSRGEFIFLIFVYSFLVFFLNKKYFEKSYKLKEISQKFKNESAIQKRIGYSIVVGLFLLSLVLFFVFLSFL